MTPHPYLKGIIHGIILSAGAYIAYLSYIVKQDENKANEETPGDVVDD